jgi:transcriptional regulator with XRE-family HTH domain
MKLSEALQQLGMTQQQAADLFGIHVRTLRRYMYNEYPTPRLITLAVVLMLRAKLDYDQACSILWEMR